MKQIQVNWNKVSPADLSSTNAVQFFALAKNDKVVLVNEIKDECLFTKVIQTAVDFSQSIYDLDIWVGSIDNGLNNFNENLDIKDVMEILEWTAKNQLHEAAQEKLNLKMVEDQKISKRTKLRMLASIA
ncbi:MAG: hypothetical protein GQ574_10635 [Crocinitomix sp.]|nr:hypothetical protein [Crocinitomix sp.]